MSHYHQPAITSGAGRLTSFLHDQRGGFHTEAHVLHACLCVGTSAHTGTFVWMLPEYQESLRMVEWGLKWVTGKGSTDGPSGDYRGELETLESEIAAWRKLLKKNPGREEYKDADALLKILD